MYLFSILDFGLKKLKKARNQKNPHPLYKKISILDGTKHIHEKFGILHFIVPK
jgi:hypothetical protein